jgi:hypothetical protein
MHKVYLFLTVLMFIAFTHAHGQLNKGALWVGGAMSYGTSSTETKQTPDSKQKNTGLAFAPYLGRTKKENSITGISLLYRMSSGKSSHLKRSEKDYGAGLFYRKYKGLGKGFYLFANGEVAYQYGTRKDEVVNIPGSYNRSWLHTVSMYAYPGISYAVNPNVHLEVRTGDLITVSFTDQKSKSETPNYVEDSHGRSVQVSTSLNQLFNYWGIAFRFLLNGKGT